MLTYMLSYSICSTETSGITIYFAILFLQILIFFSAYNRLVALLLLMLTYADKDANFGHGVAGIRLLSLLNL